MLLMCRLPLSSEILDLHEDIQVLIESSLMDCNSMLSNLDATKSQMTNAEDLVGGIVFYDSYFHSYDVVMLDCVMLFYLIIV